MSLKRALSAWFGILLLLLSMAHGNLENTDATITMQAARALWLRGDSGLRTAEQQAGWFGEGVLAGYIRAHQEPGKEEYGKIGRNDLVYVWFPMGHVWLMVPAVAVGGAFHAAFPAVEETYRQTVAPSGPIPNQLPTFVGHFVFENTLVAMLPALFGAFSVLLLFALARALGASQRDAIWSTAAIALATQFFPLTRESLSDGPGMCFLLGALLATVRSHRGDASMVGMLAGGVAAGCAVLSRYPHGTLVPFLGLAISLACWRRRSWRDITWFALGGLPFLILLLIVNYLRYGDFAETGYPTAGSWFNYPIYLGAIKILFAGGKGILWLSPVLWLAIPMLWWRRSQVQLRWLAGVLFLVPFVMFSSTNGWQSGQCWGVRYVTVGVVCLLVILLPQLQPWQRHRKLFTVLFVLGALANVTSVIAPTRGQQQLAGQAVQAMYQREYQAGQISQLDWEGLDPADHFSFLPRFSPLHSNWTYAVRSWRGDFENEQGGPEPGSANTIEPLFGIQAVVPDQEYAPHYWEDRGGRHLWWVFWGQLLGCHPLLLLLPVVALGAFLLRLGWPGRRKSGQL